MRRPSRDGADEYAEPNGVRGQLQTPRVDDLAIASSRLRRQVLDCTSRQRDQAETTSTKLKRKSVEKGRYQEQREGIRM